ncbi:MipA/OmpV family protein [Allopusillimonas ginsengisoli]|uniref:MipA/OmpV family protein n=1 Tax=Allopusillimonas ginsengisoli TaxID=453575 RepID=UPI0010217933|nr:MipA/OmpV family protein [Allopusillimonas ginsengisoli]TEA77218.1 MipA/OmpV family protein [Allopusillimonas ginsengisoli]
MNQLVPALDRSGWYLPRGLALAVLCLAPLGTVHAAENDHVKIGVGAVVSPRYQGSDENHVEPAPVVDVRKGRFFASSGDGLGVNIIETPRFTVGAGVNWMKGYDDSDVPDGIGKLSNALGGRLFVSTRLAGSIITLSATQAITKSERGLLANLRVSYPYSVNERLKIIPSVAANWASDKYMDSYFGISAEQSANSGLARYSPSAGFKDFSLRVAANYNVSKHWSVVGAVGASRLVGDAVDSPLVKRKTQVSGILGVAYTF